MATEQQETARRSLQDAIMKLNDALSYASSVDLHVEIMTYTRIGQRNERYALALIEERKSVFVGSPSING